MDPPAPSAFQGKKTLEYLGTALLIATFCGFLGYAAAISYAAFFEEEDVNPLEIAQHTFYITGCLAGMGALLLIAADSL